MIGMGAKSITIVRAITADFVNYELEGMWRGAAEPNMIYYPSIGLDERTKAVYNRCLSQDENS
jgi:hypothetical protein